jgi:SAM-dependent methyltransferase
MRRREPGRFWDARAREQPFYFVDDRVDYRAPDLESFWAGGEEVLERMLELLGFAIRPDDVVVEIGCGVGRVTRALAARARAVRAVDVSGEMLAHARRLNADLENVEWLQNDGASLPMIGDASVDGCFSHVVFQHVAEPSVTLGYIREMGRVLSPGGWAAFQLSTDPTVHRPSALRARAVQRIAALAGRGPRGRHHPAWLGSAVEPEELDAASSSAGLELARVLGRGTQFTTVLARRREAR